MKGKTNVTRLGRAKDNPLLTPTTSVYKSICLGISLLRLRLSIWLYLVGFPEMSTDTTYVLEC